jgi:hypothetical protein
LPSHQAAVFASVTEFNNTLLYCLCAFGDNPVHQIATNTTACFVAAKDKSCEAALTCRDSPRVNSFLERLEVTVN